MKRQSAFSVLNPFSKINRDDEIGASLVSLWFAMAVMLAAVGYAAARLLGAL